MRISEAFNVQCLINLFIRSLIFLETLYVLIFLYYVFNFFACWLICTQQWLHFIFVNIYALLYIFVWKLIKIGIPRGWLKSDSLINRWLDDSANFGHYAVINLRWMLRARKWQRSHINHEEPGLIICEVVSVSNSFVKIANYNNDTWRAKGTRNNRFIFFFRDFSHLSLSRETIILIKRPALISFV